MPKKRASITALDLFDRSDRSNRAVGELADLGLPILHAAGCSDLDSNEEYPRVDPRSV